ncbi:hypothetical protein ERO13_D03G079450v2 [Gossypium hirsutum]|nr:hypothetical protein ERO13_D03G079450v2 [Gossypium hirsutum]
MEKSTLTTLPLYSHQIHTLKTWLYWSNQKKKLNNTQKLASNMANEELQAFCSSKPLLFRKSIHVQAAIYILPCIAFFSLYNLQMRVINIM